MDFEQLLKDYEQTFNDKTIYNIFSKLNVLNKILKAKNIIIKPNFAGGSYISPTIHVITELDYLYKLINFILILNKDCVVKVAESDSTGFGFAFLKFQKLGLKNWNIDRFELLDLSRDELKNVMDTRFKYFKNDKNLWLSKQLLDADFFISIANIKTHSITMFTGGCKNLFGLLPDIEKNRFHPYIHDVIHDINLAIKTDLVILDGFRAMEKNGPIGGVDINLGYRIYSSNIIYADIVACEDIGLNYRKIKYLKKLANYTTLGIRLNNNKRKVKKPVIFLRILNFVGLKIQKIGTYVEDFGHRIHVASNPMQLLIIILRPILLMFFDLEKLKKIKSKLIKNGETGEKRINY